MTWISTDFSPSLPFSLPELIQFILFWLHCQSVILTEPLEQPNFYPLFTHLLLGDSSCSSVQSSWIELSQVKYPFGLTSDQPWSLLWDVNASWISSLNQIFYPDSLPSSFFVGHLSWNLFLSHDLELQLSSFSTFYFGSFAILSWFLPFFWAYLC